MANQTSSRLLSAGRSVLSSLVHRLPALLQRLRGAAVVVLGLGAALPVSAQEAAEAAIAPVFPTVTVTTATVADLIDRVPVSGTLVPLQEILVYPEVSGFTLQSLSVDVGDRVAVGDVLATLNDGTLRAQVAQAQAAYASAEAALRQAESQIESADATAAQARTARERSQSLRDSGTVTQAALDQDIAAALTAEAGAASARGGLLVAQAQVQQAQASLDIAGMNLEHATLRAPADGIVSARNGQIGAIAASGGEPIFRIVAGGTIELEAEVIETALGSIAVGDPAGISAAGLAELSGTVRRISPTVDPATRLGAIRISLDTADSPTEALRAGLFASGWIVTDEHSGLTVPTAAVLTDTAGTFVLVVTDGVLARRTVVAGLIWDGRREIVTGLDAGEVVVAKAGAFFSDGDQITQLVADSNTETATAPGVAPAAAAEASQ